MGTGYVRQDNTNQISNGNTVDSTFLDQEFDGVVAAMASGTGHTHSGATGEGGAIVKLGPNQSVDISNVAITPSVNNVVDIGSAVLKFKSLFLAGVATATSFIGNITGNLTGNSAGTHTGPVIGSVTGDLVGNVSGNLTGNGAAITNLNATQLSSGIVADVRLPTNIVRSTRSVATGSGLIGGGDLSSDRTLTIDSTVVTTAGNQTINGIKVFPAIAVTGGTINGITDIAIEDGGTGASVAAGARINLGLIIGTDVQAQNANLQAEANLTGSADRLGYYTGTGTKTLTPLTAAGRAIIDGVDAAAQRATLGVVIGTDVQAFDPDTTAVGALSGTGIAVRTAANTWAQRTITSTDLSVTITNPGGVAGNINLSVPATPAIPPDASINRVKLDTGTASQAYSFSSSGGIAVINLNPYSFFPAHAGGATGALIRGAGASADLAVLEITHGSATSGTVRWRYINA